MASLLETVVGKIFLEDPPRKNHVMGSGNSYFHCSHKDTNSINEIFNLKIQKNEKNLDISFNFNNDIDVKKYEKIITHLQEKGELSSPVIIPSINKADIFSKVQTDALLDAFVCAQVELVREGIDRIKSNPQMSIKGMEAEIQKLNSLYAFMHNQPNIAEAFYQEKNIYLCDKQLKWLENLDVATYQKIEGSENGHAILSLLDRYIDGKKMYIDFIGSQEVLKTLAKRNEKLLSLSNIGMAMLVLGLVSVIFMTIASGIGGALGLLSGGVVFVIAGIAAFIFLLSLFGGVAWREDMSRKLSSVKSEIARIQTECEWVKPFLNDKQNPSKEEVLEANIQYWETQIAAILNQGVLKKYRAYIEAKVAIFILKQFRQQGGNCEVLSDISQKIFQDWERVNRQFEVQYIENIFSRKFAKK